MELAQQIIEGNRTALGQGITLLESTLPEHEKQAQDLITVVYHIAENQLELGLQESRSWKKHFY